jgi:hypothetical protein
MCQERDSTSAMGHWSDHPLGENSGEHNIHKMRTIVLLEGDFNYYMKLIFACRMMLSDQDKGKIPIKCFVKKGSSCLNAVMTKIMMCDEPRTHHHPTCIGGNNFGDCYDRVLHPPASIALQSWGIAQEPLQILLLAMQTMRFFRRTGFAESTKSYGGSDEDCTLGLGQGNPAARFFGPQLPDRKCVSPQGPWNKTSIKLLQTHSCPCGGDLHG